MDRDIQLDIYRSIAIIYVVCVTHVVFWFGIGSEPVKSLILIEMPMIFFISGASLSLRKEQGICILHTFQSRLRRVIIPYYIYAFVLVLLVALFSLLHMGNYNIADFNCHSWLDVLTFKKIPQCHYMFHLWFIIPYLILSCTFDAQRIIMRTTNRWLYILLCVFFFIIVQGITDNKIIRHIFCYNVFMVAGYLFYKSISSKAILAICLISLSTLIINSCAWGGDFSPMQSHKFPADWIFLAYGSASLSVLALIMERIKLPNLPVFRMWNTRGYTIYLYQSLAFFLVDRIGLNVILYSGMPQIIIFVILSMTLFMTSTLLSYITYPFECFVVKEFDKFIGKTSNKKTVKR